MKHERSTAVFFLVTLRDQHRNFARKHEMVSRSIRTLLVVPLWPKHRLKYWFDDGSENQDLLEIRRYGNKSPNTHIKCTETHIE